MTIKKTGNGPLPPPRPSGEKNAQSRPEASGKSNKAPQTEQVLEAKSAEVDHLDGFDDGSLYEGERITGSGDKRVEDLLSEAAGRTSQVRSMERLLIKTAEKLQLELHTKMAELHAFRDEALGGAVDGETLAEVGESLLNRRRHAARLRRRLLGIHRRLRLSGSMAASMGAVSDLGRLSGTADDIAQHPPKDQAVKMLSSLPTLAPSGQVSRTDVPDDIDRGALGSLLASGLPGSALARAGQHLAGGDAVSDVHAVSVEATAEVDLTETAEPSHRNVRIAQQLAGTLGGSSASTPG